ncbi:MAG: TIGR01777 family oxidoreductase [Candidatus Baltobacteraceae bacterium]
MDRVAVTGATGFVGSAVINELRKRGFAPVALGRDLEAMRFSADIERRTFDPNDPQPNPRAFEGVDAVVHLAGESVAGRWTAAKKRAIYDSRVVGTRAVVASIEACSERPGVLVGASASGYYGARGDEPLFESSPPGDDFLARVCVEWEQEVTAAQRLGLRTVHVRTGIVLGRGGALPQMAAPFRFGLGGPLGSGRQFVPWIHLDDLAALYVFCIAQTGLAGPINAVAPDYATNARFADAIGAALRRPAILPAPAPALRVVLGEFAQTVLASQLLVPAVAEDAGFSWRHELLETAAIDALVSGRGRRSAVRVFERETFLTYPLETVFTFFSEARNLEAITPASLRFAIRRQPAAMQRGAQIEYDLRIHGLPIHWKTMIAKWDPPHGFVDVQLHGPYAFWRHTHEFVETSAGVAMRDRVQYALPFFPAGTLATRLVEADIRAIFDYRTTAIEGRLGSAPSHAGVA